MSSLDPVSPVDDVGANDFLAKFLADGNGQLLKHSEAELSSLATKRKSGISRKEAVAWAALPDVIACGAEPCQCLLLFGRRRELDPHSSILLLAPISEKIDLASVGRNLGLVKSLQPQPELCSRVLGCDADLLTPFAACVPGAGARVSVSASLAASAPGWPRPRICMRVGRYTMMVCNLDALISVLLDAGVHVDSVVACTAARLEAARNAEKAAVQGPSAAVAPLLEGYLGNVHCVTQVSDQLVDEFRDLKEIPSGKAQAHIIIEGPENIRLLLASDYKVEKLLLKPSIFVGLRPNLEARAQRRKEDIVCVLLCDADLMKQISGLPTVHSGKALAAARRQPPYASVAEAVPQAMIDQATPLRALVLDDLDEENVGALFRVAAAFGVNLVLLSAGCGDPMHRLAIRVSMGHVFHLPIVRGNLVELLREMQEHSILTVAAAAAADSTRDVEVKFVFVDELEAMPCRWACVVGPNGPIATPDVKEVCKLRLAVRTALPACPIGVSIVASVLLHGCVERENAEGTLRGA